MGVRPAAAALSWCPVASNVLSPPSRPESPPWPCPPCCTVFKHPRTTMSWQSCVDDQLISTNMIKNAVIAGHDGNIWASSSGFNVTAAELKVILDRYSSTDQLAMNGVTVGGTKYMFLSANDRVVRARKGQSGVHCIKTVQALIVCVYEEPVVPEQAATVTEKLGEYLISVGY